MNMCSDYQVKEFEVSSQADPSRNFHLTMGAL